MRYRQKLRHGIILLSFFLFPATFYYFSPVLILEASYAGVVNGSFIVFGLLFVSALVLGRAWCGWLCPAAGCQEALFKARDKRVRAGNWVKWMIWIPWVGAIIFLAVKSGGYSSVEPFFRTLYGFSVSDLPSNIAYFAVLLLLIILPGFIFGRRSFCHHLCWMAPFMIIGRKLSNKAKVTSLRLLVENDACIQCHQCTKHCPMSLPVSSMIKSGRTENSECILCGTCADSCEQKVLALRMREQHS